MLPPRHWPVTEVLHMVRCEVWVGLGYHTCPQSTGCPEPSLQLFPAWLLCEAASPHFLFTNPQAGRPLLTEGRGGSIWAPGILTGVKTDRTNPLDQVSCLHPQQQQKRG